MILRHKKTYIVRIFILSMLVFIVLQMYSSYSSVDSTLFKSDSTKEQLHSNKTISIMNTQIKHTNDYLMNISINRINRLFDILYLKENETDNYSILNKLGLITFKDLLKSKDNDNLQDSQFADEIKKYLKIDDSRISATDNFVEYLYEISNRYSFQNPRDNVNKAQFTDVFKFQFYFIFQRKFTLFF